MPYFIGAIKLKLIVLVASIHHVVGNILEEEENSFFMQK
jgi:hypothetical protein